MCKDIAHKINRSGGPAKEAQVAFQKEKIRREKTSKTASNHMYRRVYINANSKLSDRYRKRNV